MTDWDNYYMRKPTNLDKLYPEPLKPLSDLEKPSFADEAWIAVGRAIGGTLIFALVLWLIN